MIRPGFEGYLPILILVEYITVQIISVRFRNVNPGGVKETPVSLLNPLLLSCRNHFLFCLVVVLKEPCGQQLDLVLEQPGRI